MTTVAFQGQGGGLPKEEWTLASVKGGEKYVARVPQVFDLWQDPQERYDLFMNNFTERTWTLVMPLTEPSMSNVETRIIPDFRQNTVDSSCRVGATVIPEAWSLSRRPGQRRGIGGRPRTVIPEHHRAAGS